MKVGICGLGLIGGSIAKAYRASEHTVLGFDIDEPTLQYAQLAGIIDGVLNEETIPQCQLILIALYPQKAAEYLEQISPLIGSDTVVIDLCGTKKNICECGFALAKQYGFTFVGGHPMAGTQYSGIKYAKATLFRGAPMVLVPPVYDDISFLDRIQKLLAPAGFGRFSVTTAEAHDEMIAFTSQLAHLVSNAYVKSPSARGHKGFSAGSYKDMTRVAWLNEQMWTELFLENREPLLFELDQILHSLGEYRTALAGGNGDTLRRLLREGRLAKEEIDG
ncbi:MAG: prephenate dehydrogenase/arogenate dehydrogenase family protein [Clostridia bacterium]|nr:prephenate dehydrogenase/arogenate dehydrogenase family protein [Clostridia bacterium]